MLIESKISLKCLQVRFNFQLWVQFYPELLHYYVYTDITSPDALLHTNVTIFLTLTIVKYIVQIGGSTAMVLDYIQFHHFAIEIFLFNILLYLINSHLDLAANLTLSIVVLLPYSMVVKF